MPALFTSTNWTTLVRKVASAAKQASVNANRTLATASRLTKLQRARLVLRHAFQETYPSLHTPSYSLHSSVSASGRRGFSKVASQHYQSPFIRAGQTIRMSSSRLAGGNVAKVGFGISPVRTFASAPAGTIAANAPILLRAFAKALDLDALEADPNGPKPSFYTAYKPLRRSTRLRRTRRKLAGSHSSIISTVHSDYSSAGSWPHNEDYNDIDHIDVHRHFILSDLDHFFPRILRSSPSDKVNLLLPEKLVHSGITTVLTVGLSTSLRELLEPTTNISYRDAQLGLTVFANLFAGLIPLASAVEAYSSSRVMPLIAKLESLGIIDTEGVGARTHLEYTLDPAGHIDTLRFVFEDRNEGDVRAILGETLVGNGQEIWFAIHEEKTVDASLLSPGETRELSEDWDSPSQDQVPSDMIRGVLVPIDEGEERDCAWGAAPLPPIIPVVPVDLSSSNIDLILPSPDSFSGLRLTFDDNHNAILTPPTYTTTHDHHSSPPESYSYPDLSELSPQSTPPFGDDSPFDSPTGLSGYSSSTASYISQMVGSETPPSDAWSAAPSDVDSEIEGDTHMDIDGMSAWSGDEVEMELGDGSPGILEEDSWRSTVRGSGLMQPW
jgi:hypothetical protein